MVIKMACSQIWTVSVIVWCSNFIMRQYGCVSNVVRLFTSNLDYLPEY